jgi:formate-dependent phosphoribosylglycinamide formyltransferase (GAR transformylase)
MIFSFDIIHLLRSDDMKKISLDETIFRLVSKYPEVKDILFEIGFEDIVKPIMLQTAGKIMTLRKGSSFKKIELNTIVDKFKSHGFEIEE